MKKLTAIVAFLLAFSFVVPSFAEEGVENATDLTEATLNSASVKTSTKAETVSEIPETYFTDVPVDSPYYGAVTFLKKISATQGYPDGRFGLEDPVNRVALLKMAFIAAETRLLQDGYITNFIDVNEGDWFAPYTATARYKGIMNGYQGRCFYDKNVSLVEGLKMISKSFGFDADKYQHPETWDFNENFDRNAWYAGYLEQARVLGMISPENLPETANPDMILSRGNVASLIHGYYLQKLGGVQQVLNDLEQKTLEIMQSFQYGDMTKASALISEANELHDLATWNMPNNKVVATAGSIVNVLELVVNNYNSNPTVFSETKAQALASLDQIVKADPSVTQLVDNIKAFVDRLEAVT